MQAIFFSFLHSLVVANLKVMDAANAFFFCYSGFYNGQMGTILSIPTNYDTQNLRNTSIHMDKLQLSISWII